MPADKNTMIIATVGVIMIMTSAPNSENPGVALAVGELVKSPIYGTDVRVYGNVSGLGELECSCFYLKSGGEKIRVAYNESDMVKGLKDGSSVTVAGSLSGWGKEAGDLVASSIKRR